MSEYFVYIISVLGTVAFCSFVSFGGETEKYVRFVLGTVLLCALTVPTAARLKNFSLSDFVFTDTEISGSHTAKVLEQAYSEGVGRAVADEFSLSEGSVEVRCRGFSEETVRADFLYVTLSADAAFSDIRRIRSYVSENFGECEVTVKFD